MLQAKEIVALAVNPVQFLTELALGRIQCHWYQLFNYYEAALSTASSPSISTVHPIF